MGASTRDPLNPIQTRGNANHNILPVFRGIPGVGAGLSRHPCRTLPVETHPQTHPGSAGSRDRGICALESSRSLVDRDKTDPSPDGPPTESGPLEVRGLQPVSEPCVLAASVRFAARFKRDSIAGSLRAQSKARQ